MTDLDAICLFRSRTVATARTLPLREAVPFLFGCLQLTGDQDVMTDVREAYIRLRRADRQLELLAGRPLEIRLPGASEK